jgi:dihydroorotase
VLSLVNLASAGRGNLGDCSIKHADPDGVVATIRKHADVAIGVKIRAGKHIIGDGEQGWANLRDAIRAARESGTWLMVHIGECPMSIPDLCDVLAPGDCITHCFKGGSTRVTNESGKIYAGDVRQPIGWCLTSAMAGSFQWESPRQR